MSSLLIKRGRVVDPSQGFDRIANVFIENGKIVSCDSPEIAADRTIDAAGLIVCPGMIDMHCELREPGFEEDETIDSGALAALSGGFTTIACTANTDPPIDSQATVEFVRQKSARANHCHVHVIACVSKNREGKELAELGTLEEAGAIAFSDADRPVHNAELLRRALE